MNDKESAYIALNYFEKMMREANNIQEGAQLAQYMLALCSKFINTAAGRKFKKDFLRGAITDNEKLDLDAMEHFFWKKKH